MDTKWKSIDRRAGLKAVCLLLALALTAAAACTGLYALLWGLAFYEQHRGQLGWPYENPEEFLQRELASSSHLASILARYGGEENILAGDGLYWEESTAGRMVTRTAYILYSHLDDGLEWEDDLEYAVVYEEEYVVDGRVNQYSLERRKTREMRDAAHKLRQRHPVFYAGLPEEEQEAFMNGAYLYWAEDHSRFEETTAYEYTLRALYPAGEVHAWVYSDTPLEPDNPRFIAEEQALISRQLADFRYASEWMEGHGAVWYISVRERAGDVQEYGDARLRSYEAAREAFATYMVSNNGEVNGVIEHGEVFRQSYPEPDWGVGRWATVRAAFSSGYVTPLMAGREAAAAQIRELQGRVVATAAPALLMLLGALTLAVAAGLRTARRIGPDGEALFLAPRKVWLDAWLAAMGLGGLLLVLAVDGTSNGWWESVWRFFTGGDFLWALYGLTALAAVLAALPVFLWISALVRRVKAGDWWRHSLIWSVLALAGRALRWLWRGVKALCGALPLALQAAGLLAALAAEIMIVAACFAGRAEGAGVVLFLLFVLADAAFLAMLVIQLRAVEKGAAAAARGEEVRPPAMFSVFGRIGRSLGDLSDGINTAVAARLKSERMKTELITNVSHDLRTPLTGLIAYADLLQTEGLDSEKAPEYLDVLTQKANRLKTLTDDLFEASKAASGNVSVQLETLDLSALARQVLGELDERIGQSGLDFRLTLPEPVTARGDGRLMWRVMENLLDNAMKYSLPGSRVYLELDASGPQAVLTLKNISRHPLSKDPWELTERFTRGDESRAGEGSGLGLSIVKSFMDAQGGRLELTADGDLFKAGVWLPKA